MRTLYVVTHPEATHHVEGVVGGWYDSQLTPAGIRAAVSIAQALRAQIPNSAEVHLFSSDLQRTLRTAKEVAALFGGTPNLSMRRRSGPGKCPRRPCARHPRCRPRPPRRRRRPGGGAPGRRSARLGVYADRCTEPPTGTARRASPPSRRQPRRTQEPALLAAHRQAGRPFTGTQHG
ncbi:phosphoglycerate mutase family protein [Streptomyces sp. NPDC059893]|uniref:phosphoglycerate mutase family protein n=1 Tax=Streptomyces sp. NPDC059893 TaxID=3346990 RepID=UPI00365A58C1